MQLYDISAYESRRRPGERKTAGLATVYDIAAYSDRRGAAHIPVKAPEPPQPE